MMNTEQRFFPQWMRGFLLAAAAYNVLWGFLMAWMPESFYHWVTQSAQATPDIIVWQGRGVLVLALLFVAAAIHPGKLWFFPAIGAFAKLSGAAWFYMVMLEQTLNDQAIFHLLMNDLLWIPFLTVITLRAHRYRRNHS